MSTDDNSASGDDEELLTTTFTGEHNTQTDELFEESETVEWEFDERALFQTVAFRIYRSDEAGVREPLLNAISSGLRAERLHDVSPKVGVYLYDGDGDSPMTLVIRDNGVGVDEETLRNSLAYVGRSQNRWVADLVGKFGVGFLASFRLVSETGVFFMHTRARDTDEEFRGVWSSGGFEIDKGGDLPDVFSDGEYGTRLEFPVKDDISRADIRRWVETHAKNARVPVEYREEGFDETGGSWNFDPENVNELYGGVDLAETYSETAPVLTIEHDSFTAHCSPEADGTTLCLDSPVRRGASASGTAPFTVDIRLLSENGPVVAGPHEGLTPVSESEMQEIPEQFHDDFILEDKLTASDIRLPHPTGTRENLSEDNDFFSWLYSQFAEMYSQQVEDALAKVDDLSDLYETLSDNERHILLGMANNVYVRHRSFREKLNNEYDIDIDQETADLLELLTTEIEIVHEGEDAVSELDREYADVYEVVDRTTDDSTVFMGASLHPVKARIAWADSDANSVVELPRGSEYDAYDTTTDLYDELEEAFDWVPLKNIRSAILDEFDVPEELKDRLKNGVRNTEQAAKARELTLHIDNRDHQWKVTAGELAEYLEDLHDDDTELDDEDKSLTFSYDKPSRVVLFPSTGDANLSDHYDLSTSHTAVAYCTKRAAKFLEAVPGVTRYSELERTARDYEFTTSDGTHTVESVPNRLVLHVLHDEMYDVFTDPEVMDACAEYFPAERGHQFRPEDYDRFEDDGNPTVDVTYAPVTKSMFEEIQPALTDTDYVAIEKAGRVGVSVENPHSVSGTRLYAYANLPNWRGSEKFDNIIRNGAKFTYGGKEMVDALSESHNNGFALDADDEDDTDE